MTTAQNRSDCTLDFEGFPGCWEIRKSTEETDGKFFETQMKIESTGELPPHKHPMAEESYEVLSGVLSVQVGEEWKELTAGEKHTVPPGTTHAFSNEAPVEVINVHKPALRYEEYFRRFHKLKTELGVKMPPKSFKGMVLLGMLQVEYEEEFTGVKPPQWLYRLLASLGHLLGYKLPQAS